MLLVGDIGGTNTTIALVSEKNGSFVLRHKERYATQSLSGVDQAISQFYANASADWHEISRCCLSAAGPVRDGVCRMTNVPFTIDARGLSQQIDTETLLINDFSAICFALPLLDTHENIRSVVLPHPDGSQPEAHGPVRAVVGAGTGLGTGFLIGDGNRYAAYPSEGGHSDFPAVDELSRAFFEYVRDGRDPAPGMEPHLSGQGIRNAFLFLARTGRIEIDETVQHILDGPAEAIPEQVAQKADSHEGLAAVMELFVRLYAQYARNTALFFLPRGGLYLAGGIAAKNQTWFTQDYRFMREFERNYNDRITPLLRDTPVSIILDYDVSLYGAAHAAICL
jgi:glucokinase